MTLFLPNPSVPGGRRPAYLLTDRAKRYRANKAILTRTGKCYFCGKRGKMDVEHLDGDESNNDPDNLVDACRSCNVKKGLLFRSLGLGVPTNQYNPEKRPRKPRKAPRKAKKATGPRPPSYAMWRRWGKILDGKAEGDRSKAAAAIEGMPRSLRSEYTAKSWIGRRLKYGPSGRQMSLTGYDPLESVSF